MSRELKFRAWDGSRMIPNIGIHPSISMVHEGYEYGSEGYMTISPQMKSYDIMQYVGLKDRNGMEIYEGDIVKSVGKDNRINIIGEVSFESGEYVINTTDDTWPCASIMVVEEIEIIGNIYENPELIGRDILKKYDV